MRKQTQMGRAARGTDAQVYASASSTSVCHNAPSLENKASGPHCQHHDRAPHRFQGRTRIPPRRNQLGRPQSRKGCYYTAERRRGRLVALHLEEPDHTERGGGRSLGVRSAGMWLTCIVLGPYSIPRRREFRQGVPVPVGTYVCSQVLVLGPEALCAYHLIILSSPC